MSLCGGGGGCGGYCGSCSGRCGSCSGRCGSCSGRCGGYSGYCAPDGSWVSLGRTVSSEVAVFLVLMVEEAVLDVVVAVRVVMILMKLALID